MSWICKQCETVNTDDVLVCEVCDAAVPQIKSFSYTEIDVNKPTTFFWEGCDCDEVILCYDEAEYNVTEAKHFELSITKSSTITFRVINSVTTKLFSFPVHIPLPKIKDFSADKLCVLEGTEILLQWDVANCEVVYIDDLGKQSSKGSKLILATNNTFKIIAENSTGRISKELNVDILKRPIINLKLAKSKLRKNSSERTTLKWNLQNATSAKLIVDGEERIIDISGKEEVAPTKTTVYEIQVVGLDGVTIFKKQVTLYVLSDTQIEFNTNRLYTYPKIPFVLSWYVEHAKKVELLGYGDVRYEGTKVMEIEKDTTFELRATGAFGVKSEQIKVSVLPLPAIKSIMVPTPIIDKTVNVNVKSLNMNATVSFPENLHNTIDASHLQLPHFEGIKVKMANEPTFIKTPDFHILQLKLESRKWWTGLIYRFKEFNSFVNNKIKHI